MAPHVADHVRLIVKTGLKCSIGAAGAYSKRLPGPFDPALQEIGVR